LLSFLTIIATGLAFMMPFWRMCGALVLFYWSLFWDTRFLFIYATIKLICVFCFLPCLFFTDAIVFPSYYSIASSPLSRYSFRTGCLPMISRYSPTPNLLKRW
jgi:hypothetical protein